MQLDNDKDRKIIKQLNETGYKIITHNMITMAILGVNKKERVTPQRIVIYLVFKLSKIYLIEDSFIDSTESIIKNTIATERPFLLERMAYILMELIVAAHPCITYLRLTIEKPEALKSADNAYVTITMNKKPA